MYAEAVQCLVEVGGSKVFEVLGRIVRENDMTRFGLRKLEQNKAEV